MFKKFILVMMIASSFIAAMDNPKVQELAARLAHEGDQGEKRHLRLYLESIISGDQFITQVQAYQKVKAQRNLSQEQIERKKRTGNAVMNLMDSLKQGPEEVKGAFAQIDEALTHYSVGERWFGVSIVDPYLNGEVQTHNDVELESINDSNRMVNQVFNHLVRIRAPHRAAVIQEVQKRYNIYGRAQKALLSDFSELVGNAEVLDVFLDRGITPHQGLFFYSFEESELAGYLVLRKEIPALQCLLNHFPSFATKRLLQQIVSRDDRDQEKFDLMTPIYQTYNQLGVHFPEFPHESVANFLISPSFLTTFIERTSRLFDLDYKYNPGLLVSLLRGKLMPSFTMLDAIGRRIVQSDFQVNIRAEIAALRMLTNYNSTDPDRLIRALEKWAVNYEVARKFYCQLHDGCDTIKTEMQEVSGQMSHIIPELKHRFNIQDPLSVVIELKGN